MDTSRCGFGEFEYPDRASARPDARFRLLVAIRHDAPQVLEDLADEPLALFRVHFCGADPSDVLGDIEFLDQAIWSWPMFAKFAEMPQLSADYRLLRDRLLAWVQRRHLEADWCLSTALRTFSPGGVLRPYRFSLDTQEAACRATPCSLMTLTAFHTADRSIPRSSSTVWKVPGQRSRS